MLKGKFVFKNFTSYKIEKYTKNRSVCMITVLYPNSVVSFTWSSLKLCLEKWFYKLSSIIFWKPKFYFKICLSISLKYSGSLCAYFLKSHLCTYSFCSLTAWTLPLKLDLFLFLHSPIFPSFIPYYPSFLLFLWLLLLIFQTLLSNSEIEILNNIYYVWDFNGWLCAPWFFTDAWRALYISIKNILSYCCLYVILYTLVK